jgi:hypothetical protein
MRFHKKFVRHVGDLENASADSRALGSDAPPTAAEDQQRDNVMHSAKVDLNGWPVQRIAVAFRGPSSVMGALYVHEELTGGWYQIGDTAELESGRIVTFDIPSLLEEKGVRSPIEAALVVSAKGKPALGTYTFAMAPDVSSPGT